MPFSGSTFTNVSGATTAVAGDVVQSAAWDNIHTDYATAFTQVMSQLIAGITNRNILWMNGGLEIWQLGNSLTISAGVTQYTADRWYITTNANQISGVGTGTGLSTNSNISGFIQRNAGQTGVGTYVYGYPLDTDELYKMRGNKVSLSLLAVAGSGFTPTNGTLTVALYVGTGVVAKRGVGFTGETTVLTIATNLTPGGAAVAISGNSSAIVPATATQGELQFTWTPVGTAPANDFIRLDDIMLEPQLAATWTPTNFDRLPFITMLEGCKRFFSKTFNYSVAPAQTGGMQGALGYVTAANQGAYIWWQFPVEMRATAGIVTYNPSAGNANWRDIGVGDVVVSIDTANSGGTKGVLIYGATATATVAISHLLYIHAIASAGI